MKTTISIVICTHNRADDLRQTLESVSRLSVPADTDCELILVDNASTDRSAEVAQAVRLPNMPLRCLHEPRPGKSHALNNALSASRAQIILFTDDDVRLPEGWISGMMQPILSGQCDAVQGGIRMAPHLRRPWMEPLHITLLADTTYLEKESTVHFIGANMAISRNILARVKGFDTELGPGASGFHDDILFAKQVLEAGFSITRAPDTVVEHHFLEARLSHAAFVKRAAAQARSDAYLMHHWEHEDYKAVPLRLARKKGQLVLWRMTHQKQSHRAEGIEAREFYSLTNVAFFRQLLAERRRPRLYSRHGLIKNAGI